MYLNFMFLDQFLAKTHTHTHTHTGSDEYSIVAFCKNTTRNIVTLEIFCEIQVKDQFLDHGL